MFPSLNFHLERQYVSWLLGPISAFFILERSRRRARPKPMEVFTFLKNCISNREKLTVSSRNARIFTVNRECLETFNPL